MNFMKSRILYFTFIIIVPIIFGFVRTNDTIQWLPFLYSFLPDSFVVISVSLDISSPEMLKMNNFWILILDFIILILPGTSVGL